MPEVSGRMRAPGKSCYALAGAVHKFKDRLYEVPSESVYCFITRKYQVEGRYKVSELSVIGLLVRGRTSLH
jgi:hypothetical protein